MEVREACCSIMQKGFRRGSGQQSFRKRISGLWWGIFSWKRCPSQGDLTEREPEKQGFWLHSLSSPLILFQGFIDQTQVGVGGLGACLGNSPRPASQIWNQGSEKQRGDLEGQKKIFAQSLRALLFCEKLTRGAGFNAVPFRTGCICQGAPSVVSITWSWVPLHDLFLPFGLFRLMPCLLLQQSPQCIFF